MTAAFGTPPLHIHGQKSATNLEKKALLARFKGNVAYQDTNEDVSRPQ